MKAVIVLCLVALGVAGAVVTYAEYDAADTEARKLGFRGYFDRRAALSAGISDSVTWRDRRAADAADELRRKQARDEMQERERLSISACVEAEMAIRARLKAPSTAKFPNCYEQDIRIAADKVTWFVRGHVDAQNSFGAMLRSTFIVKLRHQGGDRWTVETAAIN